MGNDDARWTVACPECGAMLAGRYCGRCGTRLNVGPDHELGSPRPSRRVPVRVLAGVLTVVVAAAVLLVHVWGEYQGLPWVRFRDRLRFADDDERRPRLEVAFPNAGLAVRRGCSDLAAVACGGGRFHLALTRPVPSWEPEDYRIHGP